MKKIIKRILVIIIYSSCILLDIFYAVRARQGFMETYGNMAFSKGIIGFLICEGPYVFIAAVLTVAFVLILKEHK